MCSLQKSWPQRQWSGRRPSFRRHPWQRFAFLAFALPLPPPDPAPAPAPAPAAPPLTSAAPAAGAAGGTAAGFVCTRLKRLFIWNWIARGLYAYCTVSNFPPLPPLERIGNGREFLEGHWFQRRHQLPLCFVPPKPPFASRQHTLSVYLPGRLL